MIRSVFLRALLATCLALGLVSGGCASHRSPGAEKSEASGTVSLPLVAHVGENTYRVHISIEIFGPIFTFLSDTSDPNETQLTAKLPAGSYSSFVEFFSLERDVGDGTFVPVTASLTSSSFVPFTIFNQTTTTISYQFETDGVIVSVGTGSLVVNVDVTEVAPLCTILGSDCSEGSWCAPSELTGQPLACIAAGTVGIGEPCGSPLDCVANSSCFDFGSGARCTALCLGSNFGSRCELGGVCTAAGLNYGVCVPDGSNLPQNDGGLGGGRPGDDASSVGGSQSFPDAGGTGGSQTGAGGFAGAPTPRR